MSTGTCDVENCTATQPPDQNLLRNTKKKRSVARCSPLRAFVGLREIANMVFTYSQAFLSMGYGTYTVVQGKSAYYPSSDYDEVLAERLAFIGKPHSRGRRVLYLVKGWVILLSIFLKALATCDIFIFVSGAPSLLPRHWDYPILKMCRKKLVAVFLGSDIRYWYAFEQEMNLLGLTQDVKPYLDYLRSDFSEFFEKIEEVRAAERYADLILSQPVYGQLQSRPYMRANLPIELGRYRFQVNDRKMPVVVHAPTDPRVKGTKYILEAIDALRREGIQFDFRLIEKMPNHRLVELLQDCDIVVDDLFGLTVGALALESMATGKAVLANYLKSYSHIPDDCPVVNVTMRSLAGELRRLILRSDLRRQLAYAGRTYVEKYHSHTEIARQIVHWLESGGIGAYDFMPTFFRTKFEIGPEFQEEMRSRTIQPKRDVRSLIPPGLRWIRWPLTLVPHVQIQPTSSPNQVILDQ